MDISNQGLDLIKSFEGLSLSAYWDSYGQVWTIGYGHTSGVYDGETITETQAVQLLHDDCGWAVNSVNNNVHVTLNQNQFDALVSFVFNVGVNAFSQSTLLTLLNQGNYSGASAEFPKWVYSKVSVVPGLVTRRDKERALFDSTTYVQPQTDLGNVRTLQSFLNSIGAKDNRGLELIVDGKDGQRTREAVANAKSILSKILA